MSTIPGEELTPLSFLRRAALMFGERTAVIDGERSFSYREFAGRCVAQAEWLAAHGIAPGDRVGVLSPNRPLLLEAHYGVPLAGGVLVPLNIRLSPVELTAIVRHAGIGTLMFDSVLRELAEAIDAEGLKLVSDQEYERDVVGGQAGAKVGRSPSAAFTEAADGIVADERAMLALSYTSGTTGAPKGAMYHHRGAYLQALAMVAHMGLRPDSVHLWTLPMFHCDGWCFTWAVTAAGGRHVCLGATDPARIWELIHEQGVTSLNAAPTVLADICWHERAAPVGRPVTIGTGGSPPTPALLERAEELGLRITHLYGLTESFGPAAICDWQRRWDDRPASGKARLLARQGNVNVLAGRLRVIDEAGGDVEPDGETLGEIALRGNNVMLGYYRDPVATRAAAPDGWLRTGDLAVMHRDGYAELRDRAKDVIISGGENIASVEVEQTIAAHPAVLGVAVVAMPHRRWGEVPVAFVELRSGAAADEAAIVAHVRSRLAHFKAPRRVVFGPLPRSGTGKPQKFLLRERAAQLGD